MLKLNQIANIDLSLSKKIAFDKFTNNKLNGSFLLIDPVSNETVACGIVDRGVESENVDLNEENLEALYTQRRLLESSNENHVYNITFFVVWLIAFRIQDKLSKG